VLPQGVEPSTRSNVASLLPDRPKRPILPQVLLLMSVPLYLGYLIKHELLPAGVIFALAYSWAVLSFILVPVLCFVEGIVLVRGWLRGSPDQAHSLAWHLVGLGGGLGAMLAAFAVR